MKHFTLGTAGHVDHGKTALIKALTQFDCDTHKEEKERGITINLGFTHLDISDSETIGIIDVPGHKDFINTMVSGASTIDFVMLVIAADSGIMPQTIEHLNIMKVLGIERGFVVLTKIDLVDEELLLLAEEEISEFIKGTFLSEFPVIKTSAKTGKGVKDVIKCISKIIESEKREIVSNIFRMYIDRIFTLHGFGTIINGSALGGSISKGDKLYLLPENKELRIRNLQRFGQDVEKVFRGDRTSMNVVGLSKNEFKSGMVVADRIIKSTKMFDAKIRLFDHERTIEVYSDVILLIGTYMAQARMHLLDQDDLEANETGLVQIQLDYPCVAVYGDKFVIRSTSNDVTLGGGEILDSHPLHHRRRTKKMISGLKQLADSGLLGAIMTELSKRRICLPVSKICNTIGFSQKAIEQIVLSAETKKISILLKGNTKYLILDNLKEKLYGKILEDLRAYHQKNYLDHRGKTVQEIVGIFNPQRQKQLKKVISVLLGELQSKGKIREVENTWALSTHTVKISAEDEKNIQIVENYFKNLGFNDIKNNTLMNDMAQKGISEGKFNLIVLYLINEGLLKNLEGNFIHTDTYENAKRKLLKFLKKNPNGIKVGEFRDILQSNRTFTLNILKLFDDEGITVRRGNTRKLVR